jgi:hypothetical protein
MVVNRASLIKASRVTRNSALNVYLFIGNSKWSGVQLSLLDILFECI